MDADSVLLFAIVIYCSPAFPLPTPIENIGRFTGDKKWPLFPARNEAFRGYHQYKAASTSRGSQ
jgi:hypothetical protein